MLKSQFWVIYPVGKRLKSIIKTHKVMVGFTTSRIYFQVVNM